MKGKTELRASDSDSALWTEEDDEQLRLVLEQGDGKLQWAEVAEQAFPDAKFDSTACEEVSATCWPIAGTYR